MKIYRKVTINIDTGETLYEDSYDYSGLVVECKGGGGDSTTTYTQSPEQAAVYQALLPTIQSIASAGQAGGGGLYNIPQYPTAPTAPSMQGVYSGVAPYQIAGYNIPQQNVQGYGVPSMPGVSGYGVPSMPGVSGYGVPNIGSMMPTEDVIKSISPQVWAGIQDPYNRASQQLTESLGGSAGSAMAGASGVLGSSQADFWSKAGTEMGQQAWNMVSPALQAGWQGQLGASQYLAGQQNQANQNVWGANLGASQYLAGQQNQANQNVWGAQLAQGQNLAQQQTAQSLLQQQQFQSERATDYQNLLAQQQAGYAGQQNMWTQQLNQNMMPYSIIPGLTGGTYSNPVVNQGSGGFSGMGALTGAGMGGYGGYLAGAQIGAIGGPYGMAIGAGLGGLLGSGMFG